MLNKLFVLLLLCAPTMAAPMVDTRVHEGQVQGLPVALDTMSLEAQRILGTIPSSAEGSQYVNTYIDNYVAGFLPGLASVYTHFFQTNSLTFADDRSLTFGHLDVVNLNAYRVKAPGTIKAERVTTEHAYLTAAVVSNLTATTLYTSGKVNVSKHVTGGDLIFANELHATEVAMTNLTPLGGSAGYIMVGTNDTHFTGDVYVATDNDAVTQSRGLISYRDPDGVLWIDPAYALTSGGSAYLYAGVPVEHTSIPVAGATGYTNHLQGMGVSPYQSFIPSLTFPPNLFQGMYRIDTPTGGVYRARLSPLSSASQDAYIQDLPPLFEIPESKYLTVWVSIVAVASDLPPGGVLIDARSDLFLLASASDKHVFTIDTPVDTAFGGRKIISRETTRGHFVNGYQLNTGAVGISDYSNSGLPHGIYDDPGMVDIVVTLHLMDEPQPGIPGVPSVSPPMTPGGGVPLEKQPSIFYMYATTNAGSRLTSQVSTTTTLAAYFDPDYSGISASDAYKAAVAAFSRNPAAPFIDPTTKYEVMGDFVYGPKNRLVGTEIALTYVHAFYVREVFVWTGGGIYKYSQTLQTTRSLLWDPIWWFAMMYGWTKDGTPAWGSSIYESQGTISGVSMKTISPKDAPLHITPLGMAMGAEPPSNDNLFYITGDIAYGFDSFGTTYKMVTIPNAWGDEPMFQLEWVSKGTSIYNPGVPDYLARQFIYEPIGDGVRRARELGLVQITRGWKLFKDKANLFVQKDGDPLLRFLRTTSQGTTPVMDTSNPGHPFVVDSSGSPGESGFGNPLVELLISSNFADDVSSVTPTLNPTTGAVSYTVTRTKRTPQ